MNDFELNLSSTFIVFIYLKLLKNKIASENLLQVISISILLFFKIIQRFRFVNLNRYNISVEESDVFNLIFNDLPSIIIIMLKILKNYTSFTRTLLISLNLSLII